MDFINSEDYKKIFAFNVSIPNRIIARESGWLEFKETFNWGSRAKYAKSIAAFANNRGGYIVFGVKDKPREIVGLQSDNFENTDEAKITQYLNEVLSSEIIFEKFVVKVQSKAVGILHTYQTKHRPVICIKSSDGELKESDIYYRYNARSERIKYSELKLLLDQIKTEEQKNWMELFAKIAKIGPTNAAILDIMGGKITGQGGTLVIDEKLLPKLKFITEGNFQESGEPVLKLIGNVQPVSDVVGNMGMKITDNPSAPEVRLVEEDMLKQYPLNYTKLTEGLLARYSNFIRNAEYHKLRKKFMQDKVICLTRLLDPTNPKSSRKDFYSTAIYELFDKHYNKKE